MTICPACGNTEFTDPSATAPDRAAHWLARINYKKSNNKPFLGEDVRIGHQVIADLGGQDYTTSSLIRDLIQGGNKARINSGWAVNGYHVPWMPKS